MICDFDLYKKNL